MRPEFAAYNLNEQGVAHVAKVRQAFATCLDTLENLCPASRELSLVRTKLEEASFFAIKAIAANTENHLLK